MGAVRLSVDMVLHGRIRSYTGMYASKTVEPICRYQSVKAAARHLICRTKVISHHPLVRERLFCANRHKRLCLAQRLKTLRYATCTAPLELLLNVVE